MTRNKIFKHVLLGTVNKVCSNLFCTLKLPLTCSSLVHFSLTSAHLLGRLDTPSSPTRGTKITCVLFSLFPPMCLPPLLHPLFWLCLLFINHDPTAWTY